MTAPLTARTKEVAEAVKHYGSQAKAARSLGISETAVSQHYAAYVVAHPEEAPIEPQPTLDDLDRRIRALDQRMDRFDYLLGRSLAFEKRLPNAIRQALISASLKISEVRLPLPTTRRIQDGGQHGSEHWKAPKRATKHKS